MTEVPPLPSQPEAQWSRTKLVLFRFACLYFVLYALPFPLANLWSLIGGFHAQFFQEAGQRSPAWILAGYKLIAGYSEMWQSLTSWIGELSWVPVEVIHQRTGSGDTAHDWLKFCAILILATAGAGAWSLISSRTSYRGLARWLHLGVRWYVGLAVLGYGMIKLYSGQFPYPSLSRMLDPVGDQSPMRLVWTFIGVSKPYEVFIGIGECLAGLLLLSRRTSLLGVFVFVPVMLNVAALNWMYDVPVKLYSTHLLAFGSLLLVPEVPRLWALLVTNRPAPAADLQLTSSRAFRVVLVVFGTLWIGFHLFRAHEQNMALMKRRAAETPALYGIWDVENMIVGGQEVAQTDAKRWKLLAIDRRKRAWARTWTGRTERLYFDASIEAGTASVAAMEGTKVPEQRDVWKLERGDVKRSVLHPVPATLTDFRKKVEVERQQLVLRGPWRDGELELHVVRRPLRIERGFHLVQEMPYNR